jgi:putative nucleotidyltransferase with HDIG domain
MRGVLIVCVGDPFMPNREWTSFLETLAGQAAIAIDNITLFEDLQRSNRDLSQAYDETIEGWAKALELRDLETQGHCARVANLTLQLAASMGVPEEEFDSIRRGALLHDIGKMGIPDDILKKAGPLTEKDWKIMKEHPVYAYDLLAKVDFLKSSLDIPFCHHEHWDGTGYPRGLKGADIPLSARIFTVVDVWDALSSDRPYRKPMERDEIVRYIQSQSGIQFDPDVVDAFITLVEHTQTVFMAGPLESEVAPVDWAGDSH